MNSFGLTVTYSHIYSEATRRFDKSIKCFYTFNKNANAIHYTCEKNLYSIIVKKKCTRNVKC